MIHLSNAMDMETTDLGGETKACDQKNQSSPGQMRMSTEKPMEGAVLRHRQTRREQAHSTG